MFDDIMLVCGISVVIVLGYYILSEFVKRKKREGDK